MKTSRKRDIRRKYASGAAKRRQKVMEKSLIKQTSTINQFWAFDATADPEISASDEGLIIPIESTINEFEVSQIEVEDLSNELKDLEIHLSNNSLPDNHNLELDDPFLWTLPISNQMRSLLVEKGP